MHDTATDLLFVYGTLRRAYGHPMHAVLAESATYAGEARFQGRLYWIAEYPAAVASADPRDRVVGELYRLHEPGEAFRQLDAYEDCSVNDEPGEFSRRVVTVDVANTTAADAWIYLYRHCTTALVHIPGGDFLAAQATP
jgi:gamma-glutamylcyclotransferase (GGCT)/AIG2-like uncharacterized protein YtfP